MTDYAPDAGDVVWTDFNPRTGREQGGRRSALVVSPREFYDGARFVVVCPITKRIRPFGSSVVLPAGSPIAGEILVAQMRSLDALARPIRFSGMKIDPSLLSDVRRKIAFLCGVSARDLSAE
jgi:mRNA interferase MazF